MDMGVLSKRRGFTIASGVELAFGFGFSFPFFILISPFRDRRLIFVVE